MPNTDEIIIDKENMQVDRSTPLGQVFDQVQKNAGNQPDPAMASFMSQALAYTEAALVIDGTVENPDKKQELLNRLGSKMG